MRTCTKCSIEKTLSEFYMSSGLPHGPCKVCRRAYALKRYSTLNPNATRRVLRRVTIDGVTRTIAEWGDLHGVNKTTLYSRLKRGVPEEQLLLKSAPSGRLFCIKGESKTLREWAAISGIGACTIRSRIKRGVAIEDAVFATLSPGLPPRLITIGNEELSVHKWSERSGVLHATISMRLKLGWDPRDAVFTSAFKGQFITISRKKLSIQEWSKKSGVRVVTILSRLKAKWSPQDAVWTPKRARYEKPILDREIRPLILEAAPDWKTSGGIAEEMPASLNTVCKHLYAMKRSKQIKRKVLRGVSWWRAT